MRVKDFYPPSSVVNETKGNYMSHYIAGDFAVGSCHCFVCEKTIAGEHWFARVKHGECTVVLCTRKCANAFYRQRLSIFKKIHILDALRSLQWPRQPKTLLNGR